MGRFDGFTNDELNEMRHGLKLGLMHAVNAAQEKIISKLHDEIGDVQDQRKMAARRAELPA